MVISPATTYQPASQFPYPRTDIAQTSHRHRTDMCSMYDVGRITSKPYSVGGLEIQPVACATGQGGWQRLLQGTSVIGLPDTELSGRLGQC
jgi:hypothetical protein